MSIARPSPAPGRAAWPPLTRSDGWRMRRNKPGLADLKKLRQEAQPPDDPPAPRPKTLARKRSPFLPPSSAPQGPRSGEAPSRDPAGKQTKGGPAQPRTPQESGSGSEPRAVKPGMGSEPS